MKNPLWDRLADNVFQALEQGSADEEPDSDDLSSILNLLAGGLSISQSHPVNPFENQEANSDIDNDNSKGVTDDEEGADLPDHNDDLSSEEEWESMIENFPDVPDEE